MPYFSRYRAPGSFSLSVRTLRCLALYIFRCTLLCGTIVLTFSQVAANEETTQDYVCRLVEASAKSSGLPVVFLTRLIWQESSFRSGAVSPAGAQGIAQFMPGTANERGLANPFDPEQAIPKAAELLADLKRRFGNLGLAAAAYNAGAARVTDWLAGHGQLPQETRDYVRIITLRPVKDWKGGASAQTMQDSAKQPKSCLQATAIIRRAKPEAVASSAFVAPWGVQLAGNFSKSVALASYARVKSRYPALLGKITPVILRSRVDRGFHPYYRIRAPAPTRVAANGLCHRIERAGGACAVLRN